MNFHTVLVLVHVLLFAYWLGADWGVYVTSKYVADPNLDMNERLRFLQAALRIDLLPRISFTLLLPVGLQLAAYYGAWPASGGIMMSVWSLALVWLFINVAAYRRQGTPAGEQLRNVDQAVRIILVPILVGVGLWSLVTGQPIAATFIAAKLIIFGCMIVVGLTLRAIMRNWAVGFKRLATEGPGEDIDALFQRSLSKARYLAFSMWTLSGLMALFGVARFA